MAVQDPTLRSGGTRDLLKELETAAVHAIRSQRRDLLRAPHEVRSLHLEIALQRAGTTATVGETLSYLERRISTSRILDVRG